MSAIPVDHTAVKPVTSDEVQEIVRSAAKVLPHGARTKSALLHHAHADEVTLVDMTTIRGMIEYDPGEYTFTAYAGTPLAEIAAALADNGQAMPFDPPLVDTGATLGGTIAAGLSGSGRYRYGGLRDFILGVSIVDGQGRLIRGGGKVVKNAAGFDLPKLMVGSLGRLGIVVSASFKVFPAPPATATLRATLPTVDDALHAMTRLMGGPYDLEALDIQPQPDKSAHLLVRIGGPSDVLAARLDRLRALVGTGESVDDDTILWTQIREFTWAKSTDLLVKIPTTPQTLAALDRELDAAGALRHYAVGGNVAWVAWPLDVAACHELLTAQGTRGQIMRGAATYTALGMPRHNLFLTRVATALDPHHRFVEFESTA